MGNASVILALPEKSGLTTLLIADGLGELVGEVGIAPNPRVALA